MTYSELVNQWSDELSIYPKTESETLIHWLLEHHLGLRRVDLIKFLNRETLPKALIDDFERLKTGEPIQYILGKAPFYGREFQVSSSTLIPRNETEELVHLILKENKKAGLTILDIGTGTGCIPITLDLELDQAQVFGMDISDEALEVAKRNNQSLKGGVHFFHGDILTETPEIPPLDILVSNPPYVPQKDLAEMHQNVVQFEPHLALFVPDSDPIIFYRMIAKKGMSLLKNAGRIYFEIYEKASKEICFELESQGYAEIKVHQDLNGKERIISAIKP